MNTVLQQNWQIYAMAVIVGFATVMVMRWWRYRRASGGGDSALLSIVLNNMTQGVILFDAHKRILVCNNRYIEMYGVSPDVVKPGCTLLGLIENRITTGSLNIDPKKYRDEFLSAVRQGQSMKPHRRNPGRPRHFGGQSVNQRWRVLDRDPRRYYRAHPCREKKFGIVGAGTAPRRDRNRNSGFPRRRRRRTANGDAKHRGTEVDCGGVVEFVRPHV
ncbi:MAG: PAS-domain containing protein [Pseudolabrys sp.]